MSNAIYGSAQLSKTQMWSSSPKTQFYNVDGTGRDLYISLHNGGFCPPTEPTKIEELGKCLSNNIIFRHLLLREAATSGSFANYSLQGGQLHQ